jgi:hypothetical protein
MNISSAVLIRYIAAAFSTSPYSGDSEKAVTRLSRAKLLIEIIITTIERFLFLL